MMVYIWVALKDILMADEKVSKLVVLSVALKVLRRAA